MNRLALALAVMSGSTVLAQESQPASEQATSAPANDQPSATHDPTPPKREPYLEVYGFAWFNGGYDFNRVDPAWYDVERPTKIESVANEFGPNGETYFSVRPSRFGVKGETPTSIGTIKAIFEYELFGTGDQAGQTIFRLRHAWGELSQFGAGQYWSVFMDPDVFPNSLEYWGPNGMVFFRNVQARWTPALKYGLGAAIALERPGASADKGDFADTPELAEVVGRLPVPDLTAEIHYGDEDHWGHVKLAGILRHMNWDHVGAGAVDLTGDTTGWGVCVSSVVKLLAKKIVLRLQFVGGEGIENYMNDAGADLGVETNPGSATRPLLGKTLPVIGIVAFADLNYTENFASSVGYSYVHIDNSDGQAANAFRNGHYALANFLWTPTKGFMVGVEGQFGRRENHSDGFDANDFRIQFSAKIDFEAHIGTKPE